jgi:hypothetical protein
MRVPEIVAGLRGAGLRDAKPRASDVLKQRHLFRAKMGDAYRFTRALIWIGYLSVHCTGLAPMLAVRI